MKKLLAFLLLITVVITVAIQACNKTGDDLSNLGINYPPVASAGNDTGIVIAFCEPKATARLDAHLSYDPDFNYTLKFLWKQVSGPMRAFNGVDSTLVVVTINDLVSGEYLFELQVQDSKGLSAKDSIKINIRNVEDYNELNLDLTGAFVFADNVQDYYNYRRYYDEVLTNGNVNIANKSFFYSFYEFSDSAVNNTQFINYFSLYDTSSAPKFVNGECSVDFDSLYINGGGAFNGTVKLTSGSAFAGCEDRLADFPQLQVTGNMNTGTNTITMKIKGKVVL